MTQTGTSALVLGGGISGLLAANALTSRFDHVTIVDKRGLGPDGLFVEGVPQSAHLHVLLARGEQILDRLFPGMLAECAGHAGKNDWGRTTLWANPFGVHPQHESGVETWQFSRDRLDRAILSRLHARPNLRVRSGKVDGLLGDRGSGRVTGARVTCGEPNARRTVELRADLVVDCRGRATPLADELRALGFDGPRLSRIDNQVGYASQFFRLDPGQSADWKLVYLQVRPGVVDRGGALSAIEDGQLVATLIGNGVHRPGAGQAEFLAFAQSLGHGELYDQLSRARPLGQPKLWRQLANRRRHFGKMRDWPRGLIAMGDAVCNFNPVYGQGMTVAAVEAEALERTLARVGDPTASTWEPAFQRSIERILFIPWLMSTTEDLRNYELARPGLGVRLLHGYLDLVLRGAVRDPRLHRAFLRVMHMLDSPASLLTPTAALRVLARTAQRASRRLSLREHQATPRLIEPA